MIPNEPDLPKALNLKVKSDFGTLPLPSDWKGPPKFSAIGFLNVLEPDGATASATASFPLLMVCALKAWRSRD